MSDVLFLLDPEASYTRDWAGSGQTLSATGTVTQTIEAGHRCLSFPGAAGGYLTGAPPFADFAGEFPVTAYAVQKVVGTGFNGGLGFSIQSGTYTAESLSSRCRHGVGNLALVYDQGEVTQSNTSGQGASGRIEQLTTQLTGTTLSTWIGGVAGSAAATSGKAPSGLTALHVGDIPGSAFLPGTLHYLLILTASRVAEIEAEVRAKFPVGVSP